MSTIKKLAGQTAIYGLPTIIGRVLNYLLVPLYTRVFDTAEYGVVTELYAYVSFIYVMLLYGMETAFFRFSKTETNKQVVFSTSIFSILFSSLLFLAAVLAFSNSIAGLLDYEQHPEYIRWFAMIVSLDVLCAIPFASLRQKGKAGRFAIIRSINISINIGLNLFFIVLCPYLEKNYSNNLALLQFYDPEMGIGYIFISNLLASLITLVLLLPEIKGVSLKFDNRLWRKMVKYAWPLLVLGFAGIINETFDRIILKHLLSPDSDPMSQLGIYGACYKVSILMTLFIQTYKYAAEPFFFDQMKGKDAPMLYARVMNYFVATCSFIFLAVMVYIDYVLLFVGSDFRVGAPVIPILLMANLFLGVFYNLSVWFKVTDKTIYGAMISVIGMIITLLLNFILIPPMGYMGAAWATFFCYFSMMVISYLVGQKFYPVSYNVWRIIFYILLAVALYGIESVISYSSLYYAHFSKIVFVLSYAGIIIFVEKPFSKATATSS